jgi:hypothetical protein
VASERQIAANRANALRSTGPRTAAGRTRSSRNAVRHGLSVPICLDSESRMAVEALARVIVYETIGEEQPEAACDDQLEAARTMVLAQLELKRARAAKAAATGPDPEALTQVCAMERYERLALSRRKAARRRLGEIGVG